MKCKHNDTFVALSIFHKAPQIITDRHLSIFFDAVVDDNEVFLCLKQIATV